MISALNSAVSGFNAATQRVNVAANNIANALSTSTTSDDVTQNTPYTPQQVVQQALPSGGTITQTEPVNPATVNVAATGSPNANSQDVAQIPNFDQAQQLEQVNIASYTAQANVSVIKATNNTTQSLLNIIS